MFDQLWAEVGGEAGDPMAGCVIAQSKADGQDERRWDHIAVDAARSVTDEHATAAGMGALGAAALFPAVFLNLAECDRELGNLEQVRA